MKRVIWNQKQEFKVHSMKILSGLFSNSSLIHILKVLHSKYYSKSTTLDLIAILETRFEDYKRHNIYFILETLYTVEREIRALLVNSGLTTDQIEFSILNSFHVKSSGFTLDSLG